MGAAPALVLSNWGPGVPSSALPQPAMWSVVRHRLAEVLSSLWKGKDTYSTGAMMLTEYGPENRRHPERQVGW